jgi:prepilin-type N-terminal cleavage/methylation domain-containing protein
MKNKTQSNHKGFTLIELMIVIALIGILSSMILVSISSASGRARDARRASELGAIKTVLDVYAINNNDSYPNCCNASGSGVEYGINFNDLVNYLRSNNYISQANFSDEKLASIGSFWEVLINKALATAGGPPPQLVAGAKPQDPQYDATPGRPYYEYSVNATRTKYRLRAKMESANFIGLMSSLKGDFVFGSGDGGCNGNNYCVGM